MFCKRHGCFTAQAAAGRTMHTPAPCPHCSSSFSVLCCGGAAPRFPHGFSYLSALKSLALTALLRAKASAPHDSCLREPMEGAGGLWPPAFPMLACGSPVLHWCFMLGTPAMRRGPDPGTDQPHIINNSKNSYHLNSALCPWDAVKPRLLNHKPLS